MRFIPVTALIVALLLGMTSRSVVAQSSFGPEISAEDYLQHVQNLNATKSHNSKDNFAESLGQSYLNYQFTRLGLSTENIACNGATLYVAKLPGAVQDIPPVVYYAPWQKRMQMAGVLEIAERFLTQRPRPKHPVYFVFGNTIQAQKLQCGPLKKAGLVLQPQQLEDLDAIALVRYLSNLQIKGK